MPGQVPGGGSGIGEEGPYGMQFDVVDSDLGKAEELIESLVESNQEAKAEERARRNEEMAAAHDRGEPYVWKETTYDGEPALVVIYPDGTEVIVSTPDEDGNTEVLNVEYPPGVGPTFVGQFPVDGEMMTVYEMPPTYQLIVVDEDGNSLGPLEEYDDRITTVSADTLEIAYGIDTSGYGDTLEIMYQPAGPPTFDTYIVDAETGDILYTDNSGNRVGADAVVMHGYDPADGPYTEFQSPGNNEYYLVVDAEGNIVDSYVDPPDEEWSVLFGIVTAYEDGNVTLDLGPLEFDGDFIGPEQGVAVRVDLEVVEGELGANWNTEDGSWDVFASGGVDVGVLAASGSLAFGEDEDGLFFVDAEAEASFMVGAMSAEVGAEVHFHETDEGFMFDAQAQGSLSLLGAYAEAGWHGTLVVDDNGALATQDVYVGAGVEGVGGLRLIGQGQIELDADGNVVGYSTGAGAALVNGRGEETMAGMVFGDDEGNNWTDDERLDTRFEERDTRPEVVRPGDDAAAAAIDSSLDHRAGESPGGALRDRAGGERPGPHGLRDSFDDAADDAVDGGPRSADGYTEIEFTVREGSGEVDRPGSGSLDERNDGNVFVQEVPSGVSAGRPGASRSSFEADAMIHRELDELRERAEPVQTGETRSERAPAPVDEFTALQDPVVPVEGRAAAAATAAADDVRPVDVRERAAPVEQSADTEPAVELFDAEPMLEPAMVASDPAFDETLVEPVELVDDSPAAATLFGGSDLDPDLDLDRFGLDEGVFDVDGD